MTTPATKTRLDELQDIIRLEPQLVGRFYRDGNRMGQSKPGEPARAYNVPERWIGSSTVAANPPSIPPGGLSRCAELGEPGARPTLKELLADPEAGPRCLGEARHKKHGGTFRVLIKILDARDTIPFHVHADDVFVATHPAVYPREQFGKDEAYHFLDVPKGACPYTHVGLHDGVKAKEMIAAMRRGTDHVLELSPSALQRLGEGMSVKAGLLHRPGTALTLEVQQPSDVYTFYQTEFGGEPMLDAVMHPGFASLEEAAERVIRWEANWAKDLHESIRLKPSPILQMTGSGGVGEWVFPPGTLNKFSGMRLTVTGRMTFKVEQPCLLFVWKGRGLMDGRSIDGGGGPPGQADEFFLGQNAVKRGLEFHNLGPDPLVLFAIFAAPI
ncbi:MAG: hypothetical protein NTW19_10990 [Planctomycetota bacterium]|nr:hypothetical protein [Planctomycetota bacterium]